MVVTPRWSGQAWFQSAMGAGASIVKVTNFALPWPTVALFLRKAPLIDGLGGDT